jgi:dihydropteroate synthase
MVKLVGILNITPDSFSDRGKNYALEEAISEAQQMIEAGVAVIDIGAESTRPDAKILTPAEEWQRLEPVLKGLKSIKFDFSKVSIDTRNPETARKCFGFEVGYLNDVSGFQNPEMLEVATNGNYKLIFMHSITVPADKNITVPESEDIIQYLKNWVAQKLEQFEQSGISKNRLIFDPGLGFGKTAQQSFEIIRRINEFSGLGLPLFVGHSEKSLFSLFTDKPAGERDVETLITTSFLTSENADYIRVHDYEKNLRAVKIAKSLYEKG